MCIRDSCTTPYHRDWFSYSICKKFQCLTLSPRFWALVVRSVWETTGQLTRSQDCFFSMACKFCHFLLFYQLGYFLCFLVWVAGFSCQILFLTWLFVFLFLVLVWGIFSALFALLLKTLAWGFEESPVTTPSTFCCSFGRTVPWRGGKAIEES